MCLSQKGWLSLVFWALFCFFFSQLVLEGDEAEKIEWNNPDDRHLVAEVSRKVSRLFAILIVQSLRFLEAI